MGTKTVDGFIEFGPIPVGRGAASCRPHRSWHLGRRSGRVPALPYPPPRPSQCNSGEGDGANAFSPALARRRASACASSSRRAAQIASARPATLYVFVLYLLATYLLH